MAVPLGLLVIVYYTNIEGIIAEKAGVIIRPLREPYMSIL